MSTSTLVHTREVKILGIDPGLRVTGYGAVRVRGSQTGLIEAGVVCPPTALPFEIRLRRLYEGLVDVLQSVQPDCLAMEEIWVGDRDPQSALKLGHARGVLCLAAANHDVPVVHLAHTTVKRAVTGSGRATKLQVKNIIAKILGLRELPEPDDVSDALAVAVAHADSFLPARMPRRMER